MFRMKNEHIFIILACSAGFYGLRCNTTCSPHCTDPSSCDHVTGSCEADCQDGWKGDNCDNSKLISADKSNKINELI